MRPLRRTGRSHRKVHLRRRAALGIGFRSGRYGTAVHGGLAVDRTQGIKCITAVEHILSLDAPLEDEVAREEVLHVCTLQICVDGRNVGRSRSTHDGTAAVIGVKQREERILLGGEMRALCRLILLRCVLCNLGYKVRSGAIGALLGNRLGRGDRIGGLCSINRALDKAVGLRQEGKNLTVIERCPELERSGSLKQLAHTFGFLDSRQFDHDTVRVGQTLYVGLRNAEVVDTVAQDVERCGDSGIRLLLEDLDNLLVSTVRGYVLAVGTYEDGGQRRTVGYLAVSLGENPYIVVRTGFHRLVGAIHRLHEGGIVLAVAGKRLDEILHFDLEHHVHAALEVEAEVHLFLLTLLVGKFLQAQEIVYGLVLDRVQIVGLFFGLLRLVERCSILGRLFLGVVRLEREHELVHTRDHKNDREEFNCTFALHCRLKFCLYSLYFLRFFPIFTHGISSAVRGAVGTLPFFRRQIYKKKVQKPKPSGRFSDFYRNLRTLFRYLSVRDTIDLAGTVTVMLPRAASKPSKSTGCTQSGFSNVLWSLIFSAVSTSPDTS